MTIDGDKIMPLPPEMDLEEYGFEIIEEGVKKLVKVLWRLNYKTVCSCAGHKSALEPYPWVAILIDLNDPTKQLERLAETVARFNISIGKNGNLPRAIDTWTLMPIISPKGFSIYLQPCNINTRRSFKKILRLRKAADELASYIEKECKANFF
jgi:hypothetical protein